MNRPPTIQDLAGALGMHKSTVSLALSGKGNISAATRQKVIAAAREFDYEPNPLARRLARGHDNEVIAIVSGVLDVGLATEKILHIQNELISLSLEAPLYTFTASAANTGRAQSTELRQICRQRPRAILVANPRISPAVFDELVSYQSQGGILVSYDTPISLDCDQVIFDRTHNAYLAARRLLDAGHREIGFAMSGAAGSSSAMEEAPYTHRVRGFRAAMQEFAAPIREEWFFRVPPYEEGGAELARRFLEMERRPTGLCIVNDYVALAFMAEVVRSGIRVPEEVSIVGHDNQRIAAYCPSPLTCATQPVREIARTVVSLLTERLTGTPGSPRTCWIRGELVERESVVAPP